MSDVWTAVVVFAGTDVDDLVVLTLLFLSGRASGRPRARDVWLGQYLGIVALVAVSLAAAAGLAAVPDRWIGLLGLVPIALGLYGLVGASRSGPDDETPPLAGGVLPVAAVTVANGADNLSVYIPLFRTAGIDGSLVTVVVFTVMVASWCALAMWLGSHRQVITLVERAGPWLVPVVFLVLGSAIVLESGVLG